MTSEKEIPLAEYLADALGHIKDVADKARDVKGAIEEKGLKLREPQIFGRGCAVQADLLPFPFGHGCKRGPEDLAEPRAAGTAAVRRSGRARKRARKKVKR